MELLLILIVLGLGGVVHGLTGFGFALVTMGVMTFYFTLKESTLIVLALNAIFSIPIIIKYRQYIRLKAIAVIFCSALAGNFAGFLVLSRFGDAEGMKKWLGLVLIGMVVLLLVERFRKSPSSGAWLNRAPPVMAIGLLGGFIGAVFAVGGPFFVMYFLLKFPEKREYNVNLQILFVVLILITVFLHLVSGGMNETVWLHLAYGTPVVLLGLWLGMLGFERMNRVWMERFVFVLILVSGCHLLITG